MTPALRPKPSRRLWLRLETARVLGFKTADRNVSKPVLNCYAEEIISTVEAKGSPAEVLRKILTAVIPIQNKHFQSEHEMVK